jgi:hypothetical protein
MSWITIVRSAPGGACVLMVLIHVLVWSWNRRSWESLCFAITAAIPPPSNILAPSETNR